MADPITTLLIACSIIVAVTITLARVIPDEYDD
jgi:hypothetical protein